MAIPMMDQLNYDEDVAFVRRHSSRFVYDVPLTEAERLRNHPPFDTVQLNENIVFDSLDLTEYAYGNLAWAYVYGASNLVDNLGRRWAYPTPGCRPQRRVDEKEPGSYFFEQLHQEGPWLDEDGDLQTGWDREKRAAHTAALQLSLLPGQNDGRDHVFCNLDRMARRREEQLVARALRDAGNPPRRHPRLLRFRAQPLPGRVNVVRPGRADGARPPRDNAQ